MIASNAIISLRTLKLYNCIFANWWVIISVLKMIKLYKNLYIEYYIIKYIYIYKNLLL